MTDLFADQSSAYQPLAARMRPKTLDKYLGQRHLLAENKPLRKVLDQGQIHSMLLWGPPGTGKTTLAQLIAEYVDAHFMTLSAVLSGVKDIRLAVEQAQEIRRQSGRKTILFVDEVHRFNKAQQDAFLPHIEEGTFIFIGATTENPSFELNNALLSRVRTYILKALDTDVIKMILSHALADKEQGLGEQALEVADDCLTAIARSAEGDARLALNTLELAADLALTTEQGTLINTEMLEQVLGANLARYDKQGDIYYDMISALHKSIRGSAPDAALYWCCRMLVAGCDPLYIARRLVAIASEDIGNADPRAMQVALSAWDAFNRVGPAEGERAIAQAAVYQACAPKSNALYKAYNQCRSEVEQGANYEVPVHLRNAPTALMKDLGHGAEYRYAHNEENAYAAGEVYLPPELAGKHWYEPVERGLEQKIKDKLEYLQGLDAQSTEQRYKD